MENWENRILEKAKSIRDNTSEFNPGSAYEHYKKEQERLIHEGNGNPNDPYVWALRELAGIKVKKPSKWRLTIKLEKLL